MFITKLIINQVRNLEPTQLEGFERFNLVLGDNGAGKTSLIEALALAGQGRSFRTHKIRNVIQHAHSALSVYVEADDKHGLKHRVGIQRDRDNQFQVKVNGEPIYSLAELTQILPTLVIDSEAFQLLDGSSSVRMRFVDWGVFHVKHDFYDHWRVYQRVIKQRNHLLKSGRRDYEEFRIWDEQLCASGEQLNRLRAEFLQVFHAELMAYATLLDSQLSELKLNFRTGWDRVQHKVEAGDDLSSPDLSLLHEKLKNNFDQDLRYKRTNIGCHRADLVMTVNGLEAREVLSRGQKKSLICALKLAIAKTLKQTVDRTPVLLLDDLPAELDSNHLNAVLKVIETEGYQCFITSVTTHQGTSNMPSKAQMFHVEHGKISTASGE